MILKRDKQKKEVQYIRRPDQKLEELNFENLKEMYKYVKSCIKKAVAETLEHEEEGSRLSEKNIKMYQI